MRKPFEHTLTPDDRVVFSRWLFGVTVLYGAVAIIIGLILAGMHLVPDRIQQTTGSIGRGDAKIALSQNGTAHASEFSAGTPRP